MAKGTGRFWSPRENATPRSEELPRSTGGEKTHPEKSEQLDTCHHKHSYTNTTVDVPEERCGASSPYGEPPELATLTKDLDRPFGGNEVEVLA